jgi:hypothetical protein
MVDCDRSWSKIAGQKGRRSGWKCELAFGSTSQTAASTFEDFKQRFVVVHWLFIAYEALDDFAGNARRDFVKHLHGFDNTNNRVRRNDIPDFDKVLSLGFRPGIKSPDCWTLDINDIGIVDRWRIDFRSRCGHCGRGRWHWGAGSGLIATATQSDSLVGLFKINFAEIVLLHQLDQLADLGNLEDGILFFSSH